MKNPIAAIEMSHAELTVRLMERGLGLKRPAGEAAEIILNDVRSQAAGKQPNEKMVEDFEQMAAIAVEYFAECAANMQRVS